MRKAELGGWGVGGRGGGVLCIYSVSLCICIQMLLLWNHFYSNARLMRPSFEKNSREERMHRCLLGKRDANKKNSGSSFLL